jgi:hypothetical protein
VKALPFPILAALAPCAVASASEPAPSTAVAPLGPCITLDETARPPPSRSTFGLSGNFLAGTQNGGSGRDPLGARLMFVVDIGRLDLESSDGPRLGVSATLDDLGGSDSGDHHQRGGRFGALVGWGAPWSEHVFGVHAELGAAWARDHWEPGPSGAPRRSTETQTSPYGQAAIVLAWPTHTPLRPWLGLSGGLRTSLFNEVSEYWTFDAGIAWNL